MAQFKTFLNWALLATLLVCSHTGCKVQTENSSSTDGDTVAGSNDFLIVNQILTSRCKSCHEFHSQTETELQTATLCPTAAKPCVAAGQPEQSPLYYRLIGSVGGDGPKNMPFGSIISSDETQFIYDWIKNITP
jgi:uncharacterized membrane protein